MAVQGDLFMLAQMPQKVSVDTWVGTIPSKGEGTISYKVSVDGVEAIFGPEGLKEAERPTLRMP